MIISYMYNCIKYICYKIKKKIEEIVKIYMLTKAQDLKNFK